MTAVLRITRASSIIPAPQARACASHPRREAIAVTSVVARVRRRASALHPAEQFSLFPTERDGPRRTRACSSGRPRRDRQCRVAQVATSESSRRRAARSHRHCHRRHRRSHPPRMHRARRHRPSSHPAWIRRRRASRLCSRRRGPRKRRRRRSHRVCRSLRSVRPASTPRRSCTPRSFALGIRGHRRRTAVPSSKCMHRRTVTHRRAHRGPGSTKPRVQC